MPFDEQLEDGGPVEFLLDQVHFFLAHYIFSLREEHLALQLLPLHPVVVHISLVKVLPKSNLLVQLTFFEGKVLLK